MAERHHLHYSYGYIYNCDKGTSSSNLGPFLETFTATAKATKHIDGASRTMLASMSNFRIKPVSWQRSPALPGNGWSLGPGIIDSPKIKSGE